MWSSNKRNNCIETRIALTKTIFCFESSEKHPNFEHRKNNVIAMANKLEPTKKERRSLIEIIKKGNFAIWSKYFKD